MRQIFKKLTAGLMIMCIGLLSGCAGRSYTIGKDPELDEITSVTVGGGGMELTSSWNFSARRSSKEDAFELYRRRWDEEKNEMAEATVEISSYDYKRIVATLEGLKYVKYKAPKNVMDGYSESARIYWKDSPSGTYKVDFGDQGMRELLQAMNDIWDANAYKLNDPVPVEGLTCFSFSYGPTDVADGDTVFTLDLDECTGVVMIGYREPGQEEKRQGAADAAFLPRLEEIIRSRGADRWNGFSGNDSWVLDGSAFRLYFATAGGDEVSASGRECYPDGYRDFERDVTELFLSAFAPEE